MALLLKELSVQTELPVFAESDYRPKDAMWMRKQWWMAEEIISQPLHNALDLLCADFECEWEFSKGAIVLRPVLWFVDPSERTYKLPAGNAGNPNSRGR